MGKGRGVMSIKERMIKRLTDNYQKNPNGKIAKLLQLVAEQIEELNETDITIRNWRDIDQAEGAVLDDIGHDVGEPRERRDDAEYRDGIKTKIQANLSRGDLETVQQMALVYFDSDLIRVQETWALDRYNNEPAGLVIAFEDSRLLNNVPFLALERVKAGGVRLYMELNQTEDEMQIESDFVAYQVKYPICGTFTAGQGGLF